LAIFPITIEKIIVAVGSGSLLFFYPL